MKKTTLFFCTAILISSLLHNNVYSQIKDIDGKIYKTIKIGNQIWLAENLNTARFRNGDPISQAKTDAEWIKAANDHKPAWCFYNNNIANGTKYGKLYNWFAVIDSRGLAPEGCHISKNEEWTSMLNELGGGDVAGTEMKYINGWKPYEGSSGNGSNSSGFEALPGGERGSEGKFRSVGGVAYWWVLSTEDISTEDVFFHTLASGTSRVGFFGGANKGDGFSVRCIVENSGNLNITNSAKQNANKNPTEKANFSDYWKVFKEAASTNNQIKISELTKFPFWDFFSPTGNKWINENGFAQFFQNNINKREIKLAIKAVTLDGKETKTSLNGCTANMKEEKDKKSLSQLRSGFKLDKNARVFTLSISWDIDPDRAIEGFSKFYFAEVDKTFKFIGSGMSPD